MGSVSGQRNPRCDFPLNMMISPFKMMNFVLKMMNVLRNPRRFALTGAISMTKNAGFSCTNAGFLIPKMMVFDTQNDGFRTNRGAASLRLRWSVIVTAAGALFLKVDSSIDKCGFID